ncbi:MAG: iron ABC transporter permease [Armatimonadetes bacterium]|nr:iron ABC transporter permease [Armatimonadota bacterium]MDW8154455.1 iron ABC transporter permease [Armatimonadota bacterium]
MQVAAREVSARKPLPWLLPAPAILVGAGILIPLVYLLLRALEADPSALREVVLSPRSALLLRNTLLLAAGAVIGTLLLALPLALLDVRSGLPPLLTALVGTLPLAIPEYVGAYAFLAATGPGGTLETLLGIRVPRPSGYWGAVCILSLFLYPYAFLNLRTALRGVDPNLEESARSLGYGPWAAFARSVGPQLKPALSAGGLLVTIHVLADFATVGLLRYETFSYAIYLQYSAAFDRTVAAWLALLLIGLVASMLWAEARVVRGLRVARTGAGTQRTLPRASLGPWWWAAYGYVLVLGLASTGVPVVVLAHWMLRNPEGEAGVLRALAGTLQLAAPAALVAVVLALPIAYWSVRYPSPVSAAAERVTYFGYATPPLAFALALIFFTLRTAPGVYQTLLLLVGAASLHFLSEAIGPIRTGLYQAPPQLEEAARSLGYGPVSAFLRVTFPLLRAGLLAGFALVFLSVAKDLALTTLLSPPGYTTLAVRVWGYASDAMFERAAPHGLAIVGLGVAAVGILIRTDRWR